MTVRNTLSATAASLLFAGVVIGVPATAAMAQTDPVCDQYSPGCVEPTELTPSAQPPVTQEPPASEEPTSLTPAGSISPGGVSDENQLPFTGGEIMVASVVGLSLLAAGASFVIAGRRRPGSPEGVA